MGSPLAAAKASVSAFCFARIDVAEFEPPVEVGERLHAAVSGVGVSMAASSSSPYGVVRTRASSPRSRRYRVSGATAPWVASTRSAPVASIARRSAGQSAWSESGKPRSSAAPTPVAAHLHPAARQRVGIVAEAFQPGARHRRRRRHDQRAGEPALTVDIADEKRRRYGRSRLPIQRIDRLDRAVADDRPDR